jgi:hypothetical protein
VGIRITRLEEFPAIRKQGDEFSSINGCYLTKKNAKTDDQKTWLPMDSTIILGCNPKDEKDECMVEWNFDVSQLLKKNLVAAHLKITTFRTTGGLHINPVDMLANGPNKQGRLFLNDKMAELIMVLIDWMHIQF